MEKKSKGYKIVENTINEIIDSDDSIEIIDLVRQDDNAVNAETSQSSYSENSLENCNFSRILSNQNDNVQQTKAPNILGSTPIRNTFSPIIIDDSIDNYELPDDIALRKRKRMLPLFIDLCNDSDKELITPNNKRPKLNNNPSNEIIIIPDTPENKSTRSSKRHRRRRLSRTPKKKDTTIRRRDPARTNIFEIHENNNRNITKHVVHAHSPKKNNKTDFSKVGYNVYNPNSKIIKAGLRPIAIDGSNVAVQHGVATGTKEFSVDGIEMCIEYFLKRGHSVKAFIPHFRLLTNASSNPKRLREMEDEGKVICTPSRTIRGRTVASYDDRYIVQYAAEFGGIIVSNDNYRDLLYENPVWRETIEKRLLMFTWVNNCLMFPLDPLGRDGPRLESFLRF